MSFLAHEDSVAIVPTKWLEDTDSVFTQSFWPPAKGWPLKGSRSVQLKNRIKGLTDADPVWPMEDVKVFHKFSEYEYFTFWNVSFVPKFFLFLKHKPQFFKLLQKRMKQPLMDAKELKMNPILKRMLGQVNVCQNHQQGSALIQIVRNLEVIVTEEVRLPLRGLESKHLKEKEFNPLCQDLRMMKTLWQHQKSIYRF